MSRENTFRLRLKKLIELEGLTHQEFAQKVNMSERNIRRYIGEGTPPKADLIEEVCRVFPHWSQEYLFANRGPEMLEDTLVPIPKEDHYTKILYWLNVKYRMRKGIELLPDEAHQELYKVAKHDVGELLTELKDYIKTLEKAVSH